MKIAKICLACLAALMALALTATLSMAQRAGFQVAIAPVANPPVTHRGTVIPGFSQPALMPLGTTPLPPTQAPVVVTKDGFFPGAIFVQPGRPAHGFAPHPAFSPNQAVVPNPVQMPVQVVEPGPAFPQAPASHFGPPARTYPTAGTSRAEVVRQLGTPAVTVITNSGETLYFNGGITVIIQNGQVAGAK